MISQRSLTLMQPVTGGTSPALLINWSLGNLANFLHFWVKLKGIQMHIQKSANKLKKNLPAKCWQIRLIISIGCEIFIFLTQSYETN